jgi:hypothetical protein
MILLWEINNRSRFSRFAHILGGKTVGGTIGAVGGATLGTIAGAMSGDTPDDAFMNAMGGYTAGALTGAAIGSAIGGYKVAKHLGYGKIGKLASALPGGELVGLTKPKSLRDNSKKE